MRDRTGTAAFNQSIAAFGSERRILVAAPAWFVGFEVEGLLIVLLIDEDGPSTRIGEENRPNTVLAAEAETVVGLVAGALTVDQALDAGELRGDAALLRQAFA